MDNEENSKEIKDWSDIWSKAGKIRYKQLGAESGETLRAEAKRSDRWGWRCKWAPCFFASEFLKGAAS